MGFDRASPESRGIGEADGEGGRLHGMVGLYGAESEAAGEGRREGTLEIAVVGSETPERKMGSKEGLVGVGEMVSDVSMGVFVFGC